MFIHPCFAPQHGTSCPLTLQVSWGGWSYECRADCSRRTEPDDCGCVPPKGTTVCSAEDGGLFGMFPLGPICMLVFMITLVTASVFLDYSIISHTLIRETNHATSWWRSSYSILISRWLHHLISPMFPAWNFSLLSVVKHLLTATNFMICQRHIFWMWKGCHTDWALVMGRTPNQGFASGVDACQAPSKTYKNPLNMLFYPKANGCKTCHVWLKPLVLLSIIASFGEHQCSDLLQITGTPLWWASYLDIVTPSQCMMLPANVRVVPIIYPTVSSSFTLQFPHHLPNFYPTFNQHLSTSYPSFYPPFTHHLTPRIHMLPPFSPRRLVQHETTMFRLLEHLRPGSSGDSAAGLQKCSVVEMINLHWFACHR